jgi:hypothetical protein
MLVKNSLESLFQAADAETLEMVRQMVGKKEMALYMAKSICNEIGTAVDAEAVATIFGIKVESAYNRISKVNVKGIC